MGEAKRFWDEALMSAFTIAADGKSITCHTCGMTSHNLNDVAQRYCGCCHLFLDPQEPYEFDCRECGRHIVSLCDPYRVDTCGLCREVPGWFRDPELARRLDPDYFADRNLMAPKVAPGLDSGAETLDN